MYRKELAQALHIESDDKHLDSGAVQRSVYYIIALVWRFFPVLKRDREDRDVYTDVLVFDWTTNMCFDQSRAW